MRVIIEGADGVGKTTLSKQIAENAGIDYIHFDADDPADFDFFKQFIKKDNIVCDRHVLGELVYPKYYGRKPRIAYEDARIIIGLLKQQYNADIRVMIGLPSAIDISEEDTIIKQHWLEMQEDFIKLANDFHLDIIYGKGL